MIRHRAGSRVLCAAGGGPPFNVVITGGTKGVGKALATKFILAGGFLMYYYHYYTMHSLQKTNTNAGDSVAVCSRNEDSVRNTVQELQNLANTNNTSGKVRGLPVNVARAGEVSKFADFAAEELGSIDIWINNAGTNGYAFKPLMEQNEEEIVSIVETNVLGVMVGMKEAIRVMRQQPQGGHIFNMDGAGADGGATPRFAAYGATKRSLEQLSKSLRAELRFAGLTSVGIHNLSPGMVTTELLMAGADNRASKFFINCLAETPETVAEALVPRIRAVPGAQRTSFLAAIGSGEYIRFLTKSKAYGNILRRLFVGDRKGRFVNEEEEEEKSK